MKILVKDRSFYLNLVHLTLPIILQSLISFGINFTDNLMVGRLGKYAIGGVFFGGQIQGFLQMMIGGIEGAIMVLAAQYWGRKDTKSIKQIIAIGATVSLFFGVVFCAASFFWTESILSMFTPDAAVIAEGVRYLRIISFSFLCFSISQILISSLRSVETVRIGLYISLMSFGTNILFNWIFIFGKFGFPPMGVAGAALATLISRLCEMVFMLVYVFKIDQKLKFKLRELIAYNRVLIRDFIKYGAPILGGQIVWSINMMIQSALIGRINPEAVAAISVSNMLFNLVFVGMTGLSSAVSIITGKTVGAGQFELMKLYAKTIQLIFLGVGIASGVLIYVSRDLFLSLYALDEQTLLLARQFLTILSITVVGTCYQASGLAGLVKAGGDTAFVFLNDTIFVFLVVLPSAAIALFVFHASPWIVFLCLKSDQILKCFVAVVKINRFKWMKNLTHDPNQMTV